MQQQQQASASGAAPTGPSHPPTPSYPSYPELTQQVSTLQQAMTGLDSQMSGFGLSVESLPEAA